MKKGIITLWMSLVLLFGFHPLNAQKNEKQVLCSEVMKELSYFWKLDSLGINGFRLYTFQKLENAKLDTIKVSLLIAQLGNPNQVLRSTIDKTYIYYYYDPTKVTPEFTKGKDYSIFYVGFTQKNSSEYIDSIYTWHQDI